MESIDLSPFVTVPGTLPNRGYGRDSSAVRPCGMHEAGGAGRQGPGS
jgi:hypothetical protein